MLYYPSDREALAWLEASDDSWADRAVQIYDAAVQRRKDGTPAEDAAT